MTSSISVIIPVLHEKYRINRMIAHLRSCNENGDVQFIVVDGDPAGSTIKTIQDSCVLTLCAPAGRGSQMNAGAMIASGAFLLFLHCDTFLPKNAFPAIRKAMKDEGCEAGAFELGIDSSRRIFRITERYAAIRTRITRIPFGDQAIFMTRDFFIGTGGYQVIPLMEDVELMHRIKKRGHRICIIPEKVRTSPRRWEREGILCCTFRNWALQIGYVVGVSPERLSKWYRFR